MRVNVWRLCVLGGCIFSLAAFVNAQPVVKKGPNLVEVTVVGMGMDKDEALRDAQRKAIEKGAGTFIYSQSKTKDFVLVRDTILARSAGFIQSWKRLSQKTTEDGVVELKIRAVVSIKGIEDTWGVAKNLLQQMGRPKVMVFLTEKIDGSLQDDSTVQTRIEKLLLKNGFLLVNRDQLKAIDKKDITAAIVEDNPAKVQAVAKRFGAQLFIAGSTTGSLGEAKYVHQIRIFRYGADGDIKCYRSDTAQLLSSKNSVAASADRTQRIAAKKALQALGETLGPMVQNDILHFWMDALEGRGEVQLHVANITFQQSTKLRKALSGMKQVKAVNRKFHNKIAEFSLESDVNAETLAEKIADTLANLEITDVSQNVIKAKFKSE